MYSLIKKLFQRRKEELTFLLFDDRDPHRQESYTLRPVKIFSTIVLVYLLLLIVVLAVLFATPLGSLVFSKEDRAIRASVIEVSEKVRDLQDSLRVRDEQIQQIQRVIRTRSDTVFTASPSRSIEASVLAEEEIMNGRVQEEETPSAQFGRSLFQFTRTPSLSSDQIIYSEIFSGSVSFPVDAPVQGSLSGTFRPEKGHFGIDIAASRGADVRSVADGIVMSCEWTLNNGYVMYILHGQGVVAIYKHFSEVYKSAGDVVRKSELIGKVGETGLLASGPHLHFELWKDGVALDPLELIRVR